MKRPDLLPVPLSNEELIPFLTQKFVELGQAFGDLISVYEKKSVATIKPRDGDVSYADGSNWNPGFGEGYYFYAIAQWFPMFNVGLRRITSFSASGTYNKPDWLKGAFVRVKGGGGAGAAGTASTKSGGGGGEGSVGFQLYLSASLASSVTVTVGAGGTGGGTGGTTSFGTQSAPGGADAVADTGGAGGTGVTGNAFGILGEPGHNGIYGSTQNGANGGGDSAGRGGIVGGSAATIPIANAGGGGGGGEVNGASTGSGTNGATGRVLIFEF